jgi:hypothetical protein
LLLPSCEVQDPDRFKSVTGSSDGSAEEQTSGAYDGTNHLVLVLLLVFVRWAVCPQQHIMTPQHPELQTAQSLFSLLEIPAPAVPKPASPSRAPTVFSLGDSFVLTAESSEP